MGSRILAILVVLLAVIAADLQLDASWSMSRNSRCACSLSQIKGADFKPGLQFKIPFIDRRGQVRPARADASSSTANSS